MRASSRAKIAVRHLLRRTGFDLVRSLGPDDILRRRVELLRRRKISVLFDVGANAGQYGSTMRALGYQGRIVSFEPAAEPFRILRRTAQADPRWTVVNCALGNRTGTVTLHVSANSQSSSMLSMLPLHVAADPASGYVADESVEMTTLSHQIDCHVGLDDRLFVKIDTQGSELRVIEGTGGHLARVHGLQLEMSLVPLYEDQPLIEEVLRLVRAMGFLPVSIEPDFYDPGTGELLQADGIFLRPDSHATADGHKVNQ